VAALRSAREALDLGLPLPVLLQLLRVFVDNMERLAEAENRIFHDHVHEQYRAAGLSGRELMEASAGLSSRLLQLVEPTVLYFHRRAWAAAAQHDFLRHLTEDSRPLPSSPAAAPCAVVFADLAGFTPLTAAVGDRAAAEVLSRFGAAVRRVTGEHDGRVVKQIGDAFMLVFEQRRHAVLCGTALLEWCATERDFPSLHVGAHAGDVLFHDGDYVGAAVNLAARIASVTEPSQFLVTDELVRDLDLPPGVEVLALGARSLKGLADPVPVSAVRPSRVGTAV
jgi:adenylate cyclase